MNYVGNNVRLSYICIFTGCVRFRFEIRVAFVVYCSEINNVFVADNGFWKCSFHLVIYRLVEHGVFA